MEDLELKIENAVSEFWLSNSRAQGDTVLASKNEIRGLLNTFYENIGEENRELKKANTKLKKDNEVLDRRTTKYNEARRIICEYVRIQNADFTNEDDAYAASRDLLESARKFLDLKG